MEFDWDPAKSQATYQIPGFDFAYASRIFQGDWRAAEDMRRPYGEKRMVAIGQVGSDVLVVVFTVRSSRTRIISARRANRRERAEWQSSE